jgi:hypothetical protein
MAKIGEEHFSAWMRQGLRELRAALYPDSNIAQQAEYGLYGTKTPGEVAEDRRDQPRDLEEEMPAANNSVLADRMRQAGGRDAGEDRGMDLDRE